jgi:hypothetical protein
LLVLRPDDDIRRYAAVWLGPPGKTLPWRTRYSAYVLGFGIFMAILLVEALTPLSMGKPPTWELAITMLLTTLVMQMVDYDKPLGAAVRVPLGVLLAPRPDEIGDEPVTYRPTLHHTIKTTRKPL